MSAAKKKYVLRTRICDARARDLTKFAAWLKQAMPRIVLGGRFKGSTYTEVVAHHRPYCLWVLESPDLPSGLRAFKAWLQSRHGGVMAVGKHKNKLFGEIVDEDPAYCVWASQLVGATDAMVRFQTLLKRQEIDGIARAEPAPKRRRTDVEEEPSTGQRDEPSMPECVICYSRGCGAVFANCGHLVACLTCAARCDRCPICRAPVRPNDIIRTFTA